MAKNFTYERGPWRGPAPLTIIDAAIAAPVQEDILGVPAPCTHSFWIEGDAAQAITAEFQLYAVFPNGGEKWLATASLSGTGAGAGVQCTGSSASYPVPCATAYATFRHKLTAISGSGAKAHSVVDA